jgi:uncharacterized protein (DUF488 family)
LYIININQNGGTMIFTIGHSRTPSEEFNEILRIYKVEVLLDVRSSPYSRWNPAFNRKNLEKILNVKYEYWGDILGGRGIIVDDAIKQLKEYSDDKIVCLMCAEKDFNKCHRHSEIAKRLFNKYDVTVSHILSKTETVTPEFNEQTELEL